MDPHRSHEIVQWIDGAKATTEECQVIFEVVVRRGVRRFEEVSAAVAAELLARDRRRAGGDAAAMERLRTWYVGAARRLLEAQDGTSIRIAPRPDLDGDVTAGGADWRRPAGLFTALGGFLAAFQHVVQRHVFQARPVDLGSALVLAAYLAVGGLGIRWLLDSREARPEAPPGWEQP